MKSELDGTQIVPSQVRFALQAPLWHGPPQVRAGRPEGWAPAEPLVIVVATRPPMPPRNALKSERLLAPLANRLVKSSKLRPSIAGASSYRGYRIESTRRTPSARV